MTPATMATQGLPSSGSPPDTGEGEGLGRAEPSTTGEGVGDGDAVSTGPEAGEGVAVAVGVEGESEQGTHTGSRSMPPAQMSPSTLR